MFGWTPILAKRTDMVSISEEDAEICAKLRASEAKQRVERFHKPSVVEAQQPGAPKDPFLAMDEDGVAAKAVQMKIKFPKKATLEEKKAILREATELMSNSTTVGSVGVRADALTAANKLTADAQATANTQEG